MPYSDSRFNDKIITIIKKIKPKTILDVGPGHGKYARLIKEIDPNVRIEAVEIDKSYVKEFKLNDLYDKVHISSIQDFVSTNQDTVYDLVIFGDVIEHLKKSEGVDIINFYVYNCKNMLVQWPHGYIQGAWEGHSHERHISVWGKSDFSNFSFKWYQEDFMRMVLIKGYLT